MLICYYYTHYKQYYRQFVLHVGVRRKTFIASPVTVIADDVYCVFKDFCLLLAECNPPPLVKFCVCYCPEGGIKRKTKTRNRCVLGVSLLDERHPELVRLRQIAAVDEFTVDRWQTIVDADLDPAAEVPEVETKYS